MPKTKRRVSAQDIGINVSSRRERDLFLWLVAVLLFSKPVQQELAASALRQLIDCGITSPQKAIDAGWQKIVDVLDGAHYRRYDESTATRILEASAKLQNEYCGRVGAVIEESKNPRELARSLQDFKGVGPKGAEIFLREVRPVFFMNS